MVKINAANISRKVRLPKSISIENDNTKANAASIIDWRKRINRSYESWFFIFVLRHLSIIFPLPKYPLPDVGILTRFPWRASHLSHHVDAPCGS